MLRGGREAHREDRWRFGPGGGPVHCQMPQNPVENGDDFWIENDRRERVFKMDGTTLRLRQPLRCEPGRPGPSTSRTPAPTASGWGAPTARSSRQPAQRRAPPAVG